MVIDLTGRKLPSQIKAADKQGIPFVLCVGEDEIKQVKIKAQGFA